MPDNLEGLKQQLGEIRNEILAHTRRVMELGGADAEYLEGEQLWQLLSQNEQRNALNLQRDLVRTIAQLGEILKESPLIPKSRLTELGHTVEQIKWAIQFRRYEHWDSASVRPAGYSVQEPLSLGEVAAIVNAGFKLAEELLDFAPPAAPALALPKRAALIAAAVEPPLVAAEPAEAKRPDPPAGYSTPRGEYIWRLMEARGFRTGLDLSRAARNGPNTVDPVTVGRWVRGKNTQPGRQPNDAAPSDLSNPWHRGRSGDPSVSSAVAAPKNAMG
jgi:hypothetical protein